ncbi:MAG: cytochrome c [Bacteroidota bacterium]
MKNTNLKKLAASIAMFTVIICLFSFINVAKWDAPAADAAVKNPVKSDATSIAAGKTEYTKSCKMCHGATGVGTKMSEPSNFTSKEFKGQTDGSVFYKISTGHGKMPSFKTKVKADNDRWNLVNYLRTL